MRIDAHCHTNCSDGNINIEDRIALIRKCGYDAATITDHDFISAEQVSRARAAAGEMPFVPGIELSLQHADQVVHMLGYFINPEYEPLQSYLAKVRQHDRALTLKLLAYFQAQGARFDLQSLQANSLNTFYSLQLVKVAARELYDNNPARTMAAFFDAYAELGISYPDFAPWEVRPAIDLIHAAGGIAVLAHPGGTEDRVMRMLGFLIHDEAIIKQYVDWGLDGVETRTPVHTPAEVEAYEQISQDYSLLTTAGSDCHGDDPYFGAALMGTMPDLPDDLYERMCNCHTRRMEHHE